MNNSVNMKILTDAIEASWGVDTCYPPLQAKWTPENPALGQCAVTSLVIQEFLGGQIIYCRELEHYWNMLPDNSELDLTFKQFPDGSIRSVTNIMSRNRMLKDREAKESKTAARYSKLRKRVKAVLREKGVWIGGFLKFNPEEFDEKALLLMSSNAYKEYMMDTMETLALPKNFGHHFRYQLKYLPDEVISRLPAQKNLLGNELKNRRVMIFYLWQKENEVEKWKWLHVYPLREGKVIDAYRTGDTEEDVAHFYVGLGNFVNLKQVPTYPDTILKSLKKKTGERFYVFFDSSVRQSHIASDGKNKTALYNICRTISLDHFVDRENTEYFPLTCFINGLKAGERGIPLVPQFDKVTSQAYYELDERSRYTFEFGNYFSKKQKPTEFTIELNAPSDFFSSPELQSLDVTSRYNEESRAVVTSYIEQREVWSSLSFRTKSPDKSIRGKDPLHLNIIIPIKIRRSRTFVLLNSLKDGVPPIVATLLMAYGAFASDGSVASRTRFIVSGAIVFIVWLALMFAVKSFRSKS